MEYILVIAILGMSAIRVERPLGIPNSSDRLQALAGDFDRQCFDSSAFTGAAA